MIIYKVGQNFATWCLVTRISVWICDSISELNILSKSNTLLNFTEIIKCKPDLTRHSSIYSSIQYKCELCNKLFTQRRSFQMHLKAVHLGVSKHKCELCHKLFTKSSNLAEHMRVHTDEKPFKCSKCVTAFASTSALGRHMASHMW